MSFMSCHTAIIKRLFRRTQYIIVPVTVLTAIPKQPQLNRTFLLLSGLITLMVYLCDVSIAFRHPP